MASVSVPKEAVRIYFEDVLNRGDLAALERIAGAALVFHGLLGDLHGPDQVKGLILAIRAAFPDLGYTIEHLVAEGEMVATRTTVTGTHQGAFFGIAPSGRRATLTLMQMFRVEGGQIQEAWEVADVSHLLRQIGAASLPGPDGH